MAALAVLGLSFSLLGVAAPASPRVVVSIAPVHGLIAGVMGSVGQPALLLDGFGSPHSYQLRPSQVRRLERAQVLFWVGPGLEAFLIRTVEKLEDRTRVVELATDPRMLRLSARTGGAWEPHDDRDRPAARAPHDSADESGRASAMHRHTSVDPHLWLDPRNAVHIVMRAVDVLSELDPGNAGNYRANGESTTRRILELERAIDERLAPVRGTPFVVFHDAYQYFEHRFRLNAIGSVSTGADRPPSAMRIVELRARIRALGARCVFREPQFPPTLVQTLLEGTGARTGVLDPIGAEIEASSDHWFVLMERITNALVECLA